MPIAEVRVGSAKFAFNRFQLDLQGFRGLVRRAEAPTQQFMGVFTNSKSCHAKAKALKRYGRNVGKFEHGHELPFL